MTAAEHLAEIHAMTRERAEAIERQMLIEMAERYGATLDDDRRRRYEAKAEGYRRARNKLTKERSA